jgi:hypothetical protein
VTVERVRRVIDVGERETNGAKDESFLRAWIRNVSSDMTGLFQTEDDELGTAEI